MPQNQLTISSNTLFHFTDKRENLINILEKEFRPHYCLEDFNQFYSRSDNNNEEFESAIPMVCFCDIPLSQIKNHMENYGCYGIGLSKDWGMKNKISPVLYAYKGSVIASTIVQLGDSIFRSVFKNMQPDGDYVDGVVNDTHRIKCFIKPYEGKLYRNERYTDKTIRFYDEREWRFVPEQCEDEEPNYRMAKKGFIIHQNQDKDKLWHQAILKFEPFDIKYIIVQKEEEIIHIIKEIERIKEKYDEDEKKLLCSRVISSERILEDF